MGSKGVFGVLLIGLGIFGAYLAITGQLQAVWTLLTTGQAPATASTGTTSSSAASTPTTTTTATPTSTAPYLPSTVAAQQQDILNNIQALENYEPTSVLPSSSTTTPSAPISSLPSVYSTTLAQQSGVTGVIS